MFENKLPEALIRWEEPSVFCKFFPVFRTGNGLDINSWIWDVFAISRMLRVDVDWWFIFDGFLQDGQHPHLFFFLTNPFFCFSRYMKSLADTVGWDSGWMVSRYTQDIIGRWYFLDFSSVGCDFFRIFLDVFCVALLVWTTLLEGSYEIRICSWMFVQCQTRIILGEQTLFQGDWFSKFLGMARLVVGSVVQGQYGQRSIW